MIKLPDNLTSDKKKLIALIALSAVFAVVAYVNFVLIPQIGWVAGSFAGMSRSNTELRDAIGEVQRIDGMRSNMASYQEKVERYEKMLPAEQEIPSLLENLSTMAKSSGVKIVGIMPVTTKEEKAEKNKIYKEIPILISAKSGYHELGKFLASLENSDRFMKVADIDIKANAASGKRHDVDLLVLTYVLLKGR